MSYIPGQLENTGNFVPTTQIWEIERLNQLDIPQEFKELLVRLYQQINNIAVALNLKDTAYYLETETNFSGLLFNNANPDPLALKPIFRKVVNFGALPAAGMTRSVPHGIALDASCTLVKMFGVATNPTTLQYVSLPFLDLALLSQGVQIDADAVNVNITAGTVDWSAYTRTIIILEYVKF